MNILMLAPLPPPSGGIATWTLRFKEYTEKRGVTLKIINIAMQGKRATNEIKQMNLIVELKRTLYIINGLRKELKKNNSDIIHINTSCSPFGVIRDAICSFIVRDKLPIVLHCRCNIEDQLGNKTLSRIAFEYLVKMSAKVIVLNKFSKRYVDNIEKQKSVFIPNFITENNFVKRNHTNSLIKKVIFVGHIERAKGIKQIAEAAQLLPDMIFTLVGAIREDISDIKIPNNVNLVGRVNSEEVKKYLNEADIFLFPSVSEGFSNAVLEAMAMGLPIIATDVGANAEMIENKGGIILKENTGKAIQKAMSELKDPYLREKMSIWNINKVRNNYFVDRVMQDYFNLYEQLCERKV